MRKLARPRARYTLGDRFIDSQKREFEIVEVYWKTERPTVMLTIELHNGHRIHTPADHHNARLDSIGVREIKNGKFQDEIYVRPVAKLLESENLKLIYFY